MKYRHPAIILRVALAALAATLTWACGGHDAPEPPSTPHRTVLVYMVADNTLGTQYGCDQKDLDEMLEAAAAGGLQGGRLIVYHNRPNTASGNPPQLLEVTARGLKVLKQYPDDPSVYSVDPERIRRVLADTKALAQADEYGLVLWSHANGWCGPTVADDPRYRSFGEDRGHHITLPTLAETLRGEHFAFIYFDCCSMGNIETVYQLRTLTPVIVASPTLLPVEGMPYDANVPLMLARGVPDMQACARNTMQYYLDGRGRYGNDSQIAVYDTSALDGFATATRALYAWAYTAFDPAAKYSVQPLVASPCFSYDMACYASRLAAAVPGAPLDAWTRALGSLVTYSASTSMTLDGILIDTDNYCGLGTYIIDSAADSNWRQYSSLAWWADVVSQAPAFNTL